MGTLVNFASHQVWGGVGETGRSGFPPTRPTHRASGQSGAAVGLKHSIPAEVVRQQLPGAPGGSLPERGQACSKRTETLPTPSSAWRVSGNLWAGVLGRENRLKLVFALVAGGTRVYPAHLGREPCRTASVGISVSKAGPPCQTLLCHPGTTLGSATSWREQGTFAQPPEEPLECLLFRAAPSWSPVCRQRPVATCASGAPSFQQHRPLSRPSG